MTSKRIGGPRYKGCTRYSASINAKGDLVIEGQDFGPGVKGIFGVSEYEWAWTISARDCEQLLVALGVESDLLSALGEKFVEGLLEQRRVFEF